MNLLAAIRRWRAFRAASDPARRPEPFVHRHDPDRGRQLQRQAAREAFLSTLSPAQRQLVGPDYGDTH